MLGPWDVDKGLGWPPFPHDGRNTPVRIARRLVIDTISDCAFIGNFGSGHGVSALEDNDASGAERHPKLFGEGAAGVRCLKFRNLEQITKSLSPKKFGGFLLVISSSFTLL